MNKKSYAWHFLLLVFLMVTGSAKAQTMDFGDLNNYVQSARVGLVDEFFERFNGHATHPDIPQSKPDSRKQNLLMLFDLGQFKSKTDPHFAEAAEMVDTIISHDTKINYSDSTWYAVAHCQGTMDGKPVKFALNLKVQHRRKSMYKWVIAQAVGKIFDITPRNDFEGIMLYPDDHETNFMSLGRMTKEQPFNIADFMCRDFSYDATSVFAYLVYANRLKISYVEDLEFVLAQVPGYTFHLRYFEREKNNAGWLISNFYKTHSPLPASPKDEETE